MAEVLSSFMYFAVQDINLPAQNLRLAEPPQKSETSSCTRQRFQMCVFHQFSLTHKMPSLVLVKMKAQVVKKLLPGYMAI